MIKVILTADDYGLSQGTNEAILKCIDCGMLTSVNIMVNMPYFDTRLLKYKNNISLGLHFVLTAGKCVSDPEKVKTLVDKNGFFYPHQIFRKKIRQGKINFKEIHTELRAQYDKFIDILKCKPIYWNTHQNINLIPELSNEIYKLGNSLGIIFSRTFCRTYIDYFSLTPKRRLREYFVKKYFNFLFRKKYAKYAKFTDTRLIVFDRKNKCKIELYNKMFSKLKDMHSLEIVFHPSVCVDSPYFGTIGSERVEEYNFLLNKSLYTLIGSNIEFMRFEDLNNE